MHLILPNKQDQLRRGWAKRSGNNDRSWETEESHASEKLVGHFKGYTPQKYHFNTLPFGGISKEALFYFHTLHNSRFPVPKSNRALLLAQRPFISHRKLCLPLPTGSASHTGQSIDVNTSQEN